MIKGKDLKPHIGIFGKRNVGKSSLINNLTGQETAIVSEIAGATTDTVKKTTEVNGIGPVVWVDTAGTDDQGELGEKRVQKTMEAIDLVDLALALFTHNNWGKEEEELIKVFQKKSIPFILVHAQSDIQALDKSVYERLKAKYAVPVVEFGNNFPSAKEELIRNIREMLPESTYQPKSLLGGVIQKKSLALLVVPIDSSAPQGRLILPQVQLIRDILDNDSIAMVCKETEVEYYLQQTAPLPDLVIVDSQVFGYVNKIVPPQIPLTSFSVILARNKGLFNEYLSGTPFINQLKDGDKILLLESCSHQPTCEDIGRVKIPALLRNFTGKELEFEVVPGLNPLPQPINKYAMVIQCGGCVVTEKQLKNRILPAVEAGIPISNYGMTIAYTQGIFNRAIEIFTKKNF